MKKIQENELKQIFRDIRNKQDYGIKILTNEYSDFIEGIAFSILKNKDKSEEVKDIVITKIKDMSEYELPTYKEASWIYVFTKRETLEFLKSEITYIDYDTIYEIGKENLELENIIKKDKYNKIVRNVDGKEKEIIALKLLSNVSLYNISKIMNESLIKIVIKYYKSIKLVEGVF